MSIIDASQLENELVNYTKTLFDQGILNDQFTQLQSLQDESNPNFVVEVVNLFFQDSQRLLHVLAQSLEQANVDFKKLHTLVHQLKGSSSSIGAQGVLNACIAFRRCCDDKNVEGYFFFIVYRCLISLQQVRNEYILVKSKLETLLQLEQQVVAAGGTIPKVVEDMK
ncbi:histidine-containing phosphotransfer protein 1-like isoform X1 [Amaranthus tricolor]|uniref:histidine-containing phosphotransfer protein 1-like isoform X1 n=1 Tax=Amaranthus tricolor TaxID=29722 RepID=UPI00258B4172|nr:histidine-containing phosphotransfer protein 1-like isoform X1 [Amaranthus tricolor]